MTQHEQECFDGLHAKHLEPSSCKEIARRQLMDTPEH